MRHTSETQGIQESKIFCALLNIWGQLSIQTHECLYYQQNPSIPLRSPSLSPSLKRLKKWMLNIWQPCKYEIVGLDNFLIKKCHFQAWFRFLIVILYKWCKSQIDLMGIWPVSICTRLISKNQTKPENDKVRLTWYAHQVNLTLTLFVQD